MYIKFDDKPYIKFYGKLFDRKWNNAIDSEIFVEDNDKWLEMVTKLLVKETARNIFNEISKEEKILAIPTEEAITKLIEKSVYNIIFGEQIFGQLINGDLMGQIIKETLDITLKHELKDGNKRTAWSFFIFVVQNIYVVGMNAEKQRNSILKKLPIYIEMNELILEVSDIGNKTNTLEVALSKCDKYREDLSIIDISKEK